MFYKRFYVAETGRRRLKDAYVSKDVMARSNAEMEGNRVGLEGLELEDKCVDDCRMPEKT